MPTIAYFGRNTLQNNGMPNPAGFLYRLKVQLSRNVTAQDNNGQPLDVHLEFQRLVRGGGGFFADVKAITFDPNNSGDQYFALPDPNHPGHTKSGFPEKKLSIAIGCAEVITPPFLVKPDAEQGGFEIVFPDYVLCTAYLGNFSDPANVFSGHVLSVT